MGRIFDFYGPYYVGYRIGGWLQNLADGMKLFVKEIITPAKADKVGFLLAPVMFVGVFVPRTVDHPSERRLRRRDQPAGRLSCPRGPCSHSRRSPSLRSRYCVAGWSSNNKYTLIGGMRSAAQMMSYEIPLLLTVASVFLRGRELQLRRHSRCTAATSGSPSLSFLGFIVFLVCLIAEVEIQPFDLPEAEAELVEGWTTEYCGMRFGLFMMTTLPEGYVGRRPRDRAVPGRLARPDLIPGRHLVPDQGVHRVHRPHVDALVAPEDQGRPDTASSGGRASCLSRCSTC